MAHIHDLIDFEVNAYITYDNKVALIHHKAMDLWLPIGGHVELDEDPETALLREIREESGLTVTIHGNKPEVPMPHGRMLYAPTFVDIHDISPTHKHIGLTYFATADGGDLTLAADEHHAIRWFTLDELDDPTYNLLSNVKFYAQHAIKSYGTM